MSRKEVIVCGNAGWCVSHPETGSEPGISFADTFILAQAAEIEALRAEVVVSRVAERERIAKHYDTTNPEVSFHVRSMA